MKMTSERLQLYSLFIAITLLPMLIQSQQILNLCSGQANNSTQYCESKYGAAYTCANLSSNISVHLEDQYNWAYSCVPTS